MISHLVIVVVSGLSLGCISRWTSHLFIVGVSDQSLMVVVSGLFLGCISRWASHLVVIAVITSHLVMVVVSHLVLLADGPVTCL